VSNPVISVQLFSVRNALADDFDAALDRVAALGVSAVEPFGFVEDAPRYSSALAQRGLAAPSAHAGFIESGEVTAALDAAAELGVSTLIDPFVAADKWETADDVARLADALNSAAEKAQAYPGISLGYHNHAWELRTLIDGAPALEVFASQLSPAVVLEVDTYWAEVGGVPAAALLERLGERVALIHVKDGDRDGDTSKQQPAGRGGMPVAEILAAAPQAVRVLEFDDYAGDVFEGLAESLAFVRSAS